MKLVGIDRCRNAWLVAESDDGLATVEYRVEPDLGAVLVELDGETSRVIVDVPIGLPVSQPRAVDLAARRLLGPPRGSSVFPVPMRAALAGTTYLEASSLNFEACGRKLSVQAFGILDGIRDLDRTMTPERQEWIREGHPEVTFAMLSGGERGVPSPKKAPDGEATRLELLGAYLPVQDIDAVRHRLGRNRVARNDAVDALAMLVSASRLQRGVASVLPLDGVEYDERGLRMEMVA